MKALRKGRAYHTMKAGGIVRRGALVGVLCMCVLLAASCAGAGTGASVVGSGGGANTVAQTRPISAQDFLLDTFISITIYDSDDQSLLQDALDEIRRLESILSASAPGSDPDRLAQNAGKAYIEVAADTLYLLQEAARYSAMSDGAFDCTVGPLVSLWGIGSEGGHYPTEAELAQALALVDYRNVLIRDDGYVMLNKAGVGVDFGAIAKGYIGEKIKELLIGSGVGSALIDLGGDIVAIGNKPDGAAFRIGARDPASRSGDYFGVFEAADMSLVSSGSYERYFLHEGKAYHHIFDVKTGYPADNGLVQVTILSGDSTVGEGFSTAAFVLGLEEGYALVERADGIEAVFVTQDNKVYATDGAKAMFTIVNDDYTFGQW